MPRFEKGTENWTNGTAKPVVPEIMDKLRALPDLKGPGRPQVYDRNEVSAEILTRLISGEALRVICRDGHMPSYSTVMYWAADNQEFRQALHDAKLLGVDSLHEAAISIASGGELSTGSIERDKLLCGVLKWISDRRDPNSQQNIAAHMTNGGIIINIGQSDTDW